MKITKLVERENIFIVNDEFNVPKSEDNSDYKEIQKYIANGGIYQAYDSFPEKKAAMIAKCQEYLQATDWQIIRLADPSSSESLKEGVAENRALARSLQDEINACTTLEELENININFD